MALFSFPVDQWIAVALAAVETGMLAVPVTTLLAVSTEFAGRSRATGISLPGLSNQSGGIVGAAFAGLLLANTGFLGVGYMCLGVTIFSALAAMSFRRQPSQNDNQA